MSGHFRLLETCFQPQNHPVPPFQRGEVLNDRPGDVENDSVVFGTKLQECRERDPDLFNVRVDEEVYDGYCGVFQPSLK